MDVVAPDKDVLSTYPRYRGSEYRYADGPSMATPHVPSLDALIWARSPSLSPPIAQIILRTALELRRRGRDDAYGYGLIAGALAVAGVVELTVPESQELHALTVLSRALRVQAVSLDYDVFACQALKQQG